MDDAVLVGTLQTRSGRVVADGIPFFYTAASSGNYVGIIPASTPLKERAEYDLYIACTRGGRRMTLVIRRTVVYLQGQNARIHSQVRKAERLSPGQALIGCCVEGVSAI